MCVCVWDFFHRNDSCGLAVVGWFLGSMENAWHFMFELVLRLFFSCCKSRGIEGLKRVFFDIYKKGSPLMCVCV